MAVGRLEQPIRNGMQGPRIGSLQKRLHVGRQRVLGRYALVHEVRRDLRGRVEGKSVCELLGDKR